MDAGNVSDVTVAAAIAAPVGVTSSPSTGRKRNFKPWAVAIFVTAGTGIGSSPC